MYFPLCRLIFTWKPSTVHFTLLDSGYFSSLRSIPKVSSGAQLFGDHLALPGAAFSFVSGDQRSSSLRQFALVWSNPLQSALSDSPSNEGFTLAGGNESWRHSSSNLSGLFSWP